MKEIERTTIERIIGRTANIVDRHKCIAALAYAEKRGIKPECMRMILDARNQWIDQLTLWQRKWQSDTKNPNKARHHDSIAIREKYVRCYV